MKAPTICALAASLALGGCAANDDNITIHEAVKNIRNSRSEYSFSVNSKVDGIPFRVVKTGDNRVDIFVHDPARYRVGDNKSGASLIAYIKGPDFGDGDDYFSPIHEPVRDGENYADRVEILKYLNGAVHELK